MRKTIFPIIFSIFFHYSSVFSQTKNVKILKIDSILNDVYNKTQLGFSVGIILNDSLVYSKGFGFSNREQNIKNTSATVFQIGSISKTFTSAAIGTLQDSSFLNINDLAIRYLPKLEFSSNELNNEIKVVDLLAHKTKIPPCDLSWYWFPTSSNLYLKRIKYIAENKKIGIFNYNNSMYFILGEIVREKTCQSFESYLSKVFFSPLKMNNTLITTNKTTGLAKGYIFKDSVFFHIKSKDLTLMQAAGGIKSNVNDLSNWLIMWLNEGNFKGKQIVSKSYTRNAISQKNLLNEYPFNSNYLDIYSHSYGLGWNTISYRGHYSCFHSGNIDGFSSIINFYPKDKVGIILLSNQDKTNLPEMLNRYISDILFELQPRNWLDQITKNYNKSYEVIENKVIPSNQSRTEIVGSYTNRAFGKLQVFKENSYYYLSVSENKYRLHHLFDYHYKLVEDSTSLDTGYELFFIKNFEGEIEKISINLEPINDETLFIKDSEYEINDYIGEYILNEFKLRVSHTSENIYELNLPNKPSIIITPVSSTKFKIEGLSGCFIKFLVPENGNKINGLKIIEPLKETSFNKIH